MQKQVSAVIIGLNEEKNIERCLASLSWADEILFVDGGSKDRTLEICERPGASWSSRIRVLKRPFDGFNHQRNFSLDSAAHEWVLVVDADESCTVELQNKIKSLMGENPGPPQNAYKVRRVEYFLGKEIKGGIWNPSYQDRFFSKKGVRYVNNVHEYPKFPSPPGMIHEPLEHSPDVTVESLIHKMNRYTTVEALDRVERGVRTNIFRMLFAFPAMFLKTYFYYGGYRDGIHGFVISLLEGVSRTVRHVKIWQYGRQKDLAARK